MACNRSTRLMAMLLLLMAAVAWEQLVDASKIAYKKPLYGKTSYMKEKRFKLRTTNSPATTEADWPVPVEFIINSTPRTAATTERQTETATETGTNSSTTLAVSLESGSNSSSSSTTSTTESSLDNTLPTPPTPPTAALNQPVPCTCGVFLSSQIKNGLPETPLIHNEMDRMFPCNAIGRKQCQTKCLETIVQHLPNSANIVCATLGHNCHKERAYLFIKNCHNQWVNTNLQAGREYCCKEGVPYRCPLIG
ncbi:follicle cell protein 3C-1 [Drosophila innubila]|uniref:follicle cell protein 3C-1 n=1 Tax=Drosophila innubila TaxID=198719 RepID=UPI00148D2A47|nr:follicle cell protein 3C-1 [Drosophila innubila]